METKKKNNKQSQKWLEPSVSHWYYIVHSPCVCAHMTTLWTVAATALMQMMLAMMEKATRNERINEPNKIKFKKTAMNECTNDRIRCGVSVYCFLGALRTCVGGGLCRLMLFAITTVTVFCVCCVCMCEMGKRQELIFVCHICCWRIFTAE